MSQNSIPPSWVTDEIPLPDSGQAGDSGDPSGILKAEPVPDSLQPAGVVSWEEYTSFTHVMRLQSDGKKVLKKVIARNVNNLISALMWRDEFSGLYRYDEFACEMKIVNQPKWDKSPHWKAHRIEDVDYTDLQQALERKGYPCSVDGVARAIEFVARKNSFHPAREWMESISWDGKHRLERALTYYFGCEYFQDESPVYLAEIFKRWMIGGVARVYEPGCQMDYMLILSGPQGAGKSTAFKVLSTVGGVDYYGKMRIDQIGNRDLILSCNGKLILELPELAGLGKKDIREFKDWLTTQDGEGRMAYDRLNKKFPRQFIIGASDNPTGFGWMNDPTGGRRFWPATCGNKISLDALRHDCEQLWAEAVHWYKSGLKPYLPPEMEHLAEKARFKFQEIDPWYAMIAKEFECMESVSSEDIYKFLGLEKRDVKQPEQRRVSRAMQRIGFEYQDNGRNPKYKKIKEQEPLPLEKE